jgi:uncharacterized protein (TIGR02118 family)
MIKVSLLFPKAERSWFDFDYYLRKHLPMLIGKLVESPGFRGLSVEKGLEGENPNSIPPYIVSCHILLHSIEDFYTFEYDNSLYEDISKFTNAKPVIQVSEKIKLEAT